MSHEKIPFWQRYAAQLYAQNQQYDAEQKDRLQRWRSVEPESAALLSLLACSKCAKKVLEIGTSNGYASLWLAAAMQQTAGHLSTWEVDAQRSGLAQSHAQQAGVASYVSFVVGDAAALLAKTQQIYDMVFLDAERSAYVSYWPHLQRLLAHSGSLLVVDNVLSHADQVAELVALIQANPAWMSVTLPVGAGLLLATRIGF